MKNTEGSLIELKKNLSEEEKRVIRANRKTSKGNDELFNDIIHAINEENDITPHPFPTEKEEWPPPVIFDECNTVPFPVEVLTPTIQNMVKAVAIHTQTPIDLAALIAIGVLSTAFSKKFVIEPKKDWKENLNTYTASFLDSSSRKSAVYQAMTKPIYLYDYELSEEMKPKVAKREVKREALKKRIEKLQNDYAKSKDVSGILQEIEQASDELLKYPELYEPTLVLDNVTTEKVVSILKENNEKVSIMSAEGDLFEKFKNPAEQGKLDVYLKGYSGDPLRVDRISRETEKLNEPLLTICISAQPTVIRNVMQYLHDRGLMARFLFTMPNDNLGYRDPYPPSVPSEVDSQYKAFIRKMLLFSPKKPIILSLSEGAKAVLVNLIEDIEKEFRVNGLFEGFLKFWGGKLVGQLIRIAGLLHVAQFAEKSELENIPTEVSLETLNKAISLKNYFITHAQKTFGVMKQNETFNDATYLLEKILNEGKLVIEKQTIHQKTKKRLHGKQRYSRAYDILEFHSYIKQVKGGKYGNKGLILVNPILFEENAD